jgi:hypothetical protein
MKKQRQKNALERLEAQLASGTKPEKIDGKTTNTRVAISDHDKKRITKEITILKSKNL